jgi:hypothetical protein
MKHKPSMAAISALGQKPTCAAHKPMSAKWHKRTSADRYSATFVGVSRSNSKKQFSTALRAEQR